METTIHSKNYNGIDLMKFICAIMVFVIHISPFTAAMGGEVSTVEYYINFGLQAGVCRLAVPFYFVCSGFFLFRKMDSGLVDTEKVKTYCFKIFRLIGMWSVVLFIGWQGHLWYLGATIVALVFLSLLLYYRVDLKWLIVIACVLYVFGMLGDAYFGIIKPIVSDGVMQQIYNIYKFFVKESRNGLFMGYIFILIGYMFSQDKIKIKQNAALVAFGASVGCLIMEAFLLKKNDISVDYNMYIFLLPTVIFLFAFVSSLTLEDRPIYKTLRTVGVLVYFLHILIKELIVFGTDLIYGAFSIDLQPMRFFITMPVTLLVAFCIERLSHKDRYKWITWFLA